MPKVTNTYRLTASDMQILGAIEVMSHYKSMHGLGTDANSFLSYLEVQALKIDRGMKTTAYVATGLKREANISMDKLGATAAELILASATPEQLSDAEFEKATYELDTNEKLPLYMFVGKSWQQVKQERLELANPKVISDVEVKQIAGEEDGNKGELDQLFGKL